jgi:hypothetical protein
MKILDLLDICNWRYALDNPTDFNNFLCRFKGHPDGPRYFNVNGTEPDMRCINCNEDLG